MTDPGAGTGPARIDAEGVVAPEGVHDLLLDGRRIWSFRGAGDERLPWPGPLQGFLDGVARLAVRDQDGTVLAEAEVRFGDSEAPVRVEDPSGRPLVLDSKGRLTLPFEDSEDTGALLAAAHEVLEVMARAGLDGFLAYGTLLGAVREGDFIAHDNDLDLGYVSRETVPVDVIRESFALERALVRAGMRVERYSGAGLKVTVGAGDDTEVDRGLDIFGGFWADGRLALLGEILTPFEEDWIWPLGTVRLAGETFPAPARPERLLEAMYGEGWRVPDPTFSFDPGTAARERLDEWFRGIRERRNRWDRFYSGSAHSRPNFNPHQVAKVVHRDEPDATVVDVGCGRGQDASWLARRGHRAVGLDYSTRAMEFFAVRSAEKGWPVEYHTVNLLELRHVLGWGARLARLDGPRVVVARHVVNATNRRGREGLWRLASMTLRGGGRLYLEFFGAERPRPHGEDDLVWEVDPAQVTEEAARFGGAVAATEWFEPEGYEMPWKTPEWDEPPRACRMVMEWT